MPTTSIVRTYKESTQWCVDVSVNDIIYQLTFQAYPPSGPAPDASVIQAELDNLVLSIEGAYQFIAEDGYVV